MQIVHKSAIVLYPVQSMYRLVCDVERYPEFVPWCIDGQILSEDDTMQKASLTFSFKGIKQTLITENTLESDKRIRMRLVDGPFQALFGAWEFVDLSVEDYEASSIILDLKFTFQHDTINALFESAFRRVAHHLVDTFVKRADDLHGKV